MSKKTRIEALERQSQDNKYNLNDMKLFTLPDLRNQLAEARGEAKKQDREISILHADIRSLKEKISLICQHFGLLIQLIPAEPEHYAIVAKEFPKKQLHCAQDD